MSWVELGFASGRSRRSFLTAGAALAVACVSMLVSAASASAAGGISGDVIDAVSKAPVEEVVVCAFNDEEEIEECAETDSGGNYLITGLPNDDYVVEFWAPYLNYQTQFFDGKSSIAAADPVTVNNSSVIGVDAELVKFPGRSIEGTVTDAASGGPIAGVEVCAIAIAEEELWCSETVADGTYDLFALTPGQYVVEFWAPHLGYVTQFYNGAASFDAATPVNVTEGSKALGINAALAKVPPEVPVVVPPGPPAVVPPVTVPKGKAKAKGKKCKKGFRPKKVKGKKRCVKIKKKKGRR